MRHIPLLLLAGLLWACGSDRALRSALSRADELMESRPDSALALLRPFEGAEISSEKQRARFALLYSMALHKNFIDVESDSLISIASNYFRSGREAMLATYYRAYINHNARRSDKAILLALESFDKAESLKDTLFMARSLELRGLIEYDSYLMEESLPHFREAAYYYKVAGKTRNHLGALSTAALSLDWLGRSQESVQLLDSLRHQAFEIEDTVFAAQLTAKLIPILLKNGNPDPALTDREVTALAGFDYVYSHNPYALSSLALHRLYKGDYQGCDSLLRCARAAVSLEADKASVLSAEEERARLSGDYLKASELADSMLRLQSAVVTGLFKRDITTAERDYMAQRSLKAEAERSSARAGLWLSIAGFAILCTVAFLIVRRIFRKRNEKSNAQLNDKIAEIQLLTDTLRRTRSDHSSLAGSLIQTHYKALDSICDQYHQGAESAVDLKLLKERLDSAMLELRSEESMAAIREFVNRNFDSILDRVKEAYPKTKETELTFIALIKAGFTARAVCLLTGMKRSSFYSKKDRTAEKLAQIGITI